VALERGGIRFIKNLKAGDTVSVHWGMAIEKLSAKGERALMEYTNKNIRAINDSGALRKCEK
jgi:hydrogenase maturation factor